MIHEIEIMVFWTESYVTAILPFWDEILVFLAGKDIFTGQIIATSRDLTPKGSWGRDIPLLIR